MHSRLRQPVKSNKKPQHPSQKTTKALYNQRQHKPVSNSNQIPDGECKMDIEKIGRYQIISEIGRGGMATVYLAKDPNFEREVAIKILPRAFLHDPQFRARFEREAKTIAALEHQSIVPVYDFGEEDEQPYIVMRLMTGGSLADKLKNGKLPLEQATKIVTRIAQALDAAHAKGIIHRDIKPGNILFDQYDNAYLTDFGIARIAEGGSTLTGTTILGTPAYMSPEQVQGDREIDGRSDIYSLGIIFYHMLTGKPPYQAATPAKIMMMHVLEPLPDIRKSLPNLPVAYEQVLLNALAKDPDERYATAGEFAASLLAASRGEVIPSLAFPETQSGMERPADLASQSSMVAQPRIAIPPKAVRSKTHIPSEQPKAKKRLPLIAIIIGIAGILGILALAGFFFVFLNSQRTPAAPVPSATLRATVAAIVSPVSAQTVQQAAVANTNTPAAKPSETPLPAKITDTPVPQPSETAQQAAAIPVIGGADKIAFLNANDLWVMNVDGSGLKQLTFDGTTKTDLAWIPNSMTIKYVSGNCAWSAEADTGKLDFLVCFNAGELKSFDISPDGSQVAVSLSNQLFVVPFDNDKLSNVHYHTDLSNMSTCPALSPLKTKLNTSVPVKLVRWSKNSRRLGILIISNDRGKQVDLIRVINIENCKVLPLRIDEFPATRFKLPGYAKTPYIRNFAWDGKNLFAVNSYTRNDGYGDLYIYNLELHKGRKVNPINKKCCYRDATFSPDGSYLLFAYQPFIAGATAQLYYIPLGTIGTGKQYNPILLPKDFFSNPKEKPQPVLHPANKP